MSETLADPQVHTIRSAGNPWPNAWLASASLDRDEVNPDTLTAMYGLLIGSLEGTVEDDEAAADWATLRLRSVRGAGVVVLSARVQAL